MSELRKDPIVGRWVIVAPDRALRPTDFRRARPQPTGGLCPFCPGNESLTTPEVLSIRPDASARDTPGWTLRVVPNRYPALRVEAQLRREGEGLYDRIEGVGAHEVVIETATHDRDLGALGVGEVEQVLWAWSERMRDLSRDQRLRSIVVFRNHGDEAGATLTHPHSQLIALPLVPAALAEELEGAAAHWRLKERCIYCDVIRQELKERTRIVYENDACVALTPFAARTPFETWVLPKGHGAHFEEEPRGQLRAVAEVLRETLRRLDVALEKPSCNLVLHSAPLRERGLPHFHWHLEILPAVTRVAGFEWGSGFHINPVSPEESAEFLRRTKAD